MSLRREILLERIEKAAAEGEQLRQVDLVNYIIGLEKDNDKESTESFKNDFYIYKRYQPSVANCLKTLRKRKKISIIDRCYYPYSTDQEREVIRDLIIQNVRFSKHDSFDISGTTIAVPVEMGNINYTKELFQGFVGKKNCYDILIADGYLLIMLRGTKKTCSKIHKAVHEIVATGYKQPKGRKKIKLQKK